jgi:SAM-dependent MidA family methyltransferase
MPELTTETGGIAAGILAAIAAMGERVWRQHGRIGRIEKELELAASQREEIAKHTDIQRKEAREDLKEYMVRSEQTQEKMYCLIRKQGETLAVICDRLEIGG